METKTRADGLRFWRVRVPLKFAPRFRKFRAKILFFFLTLLSFALIGMLAAVNTANLRSARAQIKEDLKVAESVFQRVVGSRIRQLEDGALLLSSDFAFKQAIATGDHPTIVSALDNLKTRIDANGMALVSPEYSLIADTLRPEATDEEFSFPELILKAEEEGQASSIVLIDGLAHQTVVAPVLAPEPIAWLAISFVIDAPFLNELQRITRSHISLLKVNKQNDLSMIASTLVKPLYEELTETLSVRNLSMAESTLLEIMGEDYVTIFSTLQKSEELTVHVVLQRSLEKALQPYYRLRSLLIAISIGSLLISIMGGVVIAGTVSKPIMKLVEGVKEIKKGNYEYTVEVFQEDEIGELADAFNEMTLGLAERDKVRNLLGKVVSPAVAHDLLSRKEVKLGGEERVLTAFFSDMADFTSISESLEPSELVLLLNEYLSAMTDVINELGGVVDKYIGDAIVAFWGAPVLIKNHAELSVRAALRMQGKLAEMRIRWKEQGRHELYMRVGINTGLMVVGNMGSKDRMDYTMIGDAVNLAARLEGANKYYGSRVMISESTYAIVKEMFLCRQLDMVRVQGKTEPIKVYEAIGEMDTVSTSQIHFANGFENAVECFRRMEFEEAARLFRECESLYQKKDKACELYLQRISDLAKIPPPAGWDTVYPLSK